MTANFRATTDAAAVFRHRTAAVLATSNTASVTDSFAEMSKNSVILQSVEIVAQAFPIATNLSGKRASVD